jgi:hypothetical protein
MRTSPTAVVAVTCAAALALVGCTSGKSKDVKTSSAPPKSSAVATTAQSAAAPTLTQYPLPTASISNDVNKRKAVAIASCAPSDGGWSASGTAQNSGTSAETYNITIFFTTTQATTLDYATTSVKVSPGKTEKWTATVKFSAPKDVLCVLRGVG